ETVGVRNWNDAEIEINIGNPHRVANLIAIGQQLFATKTDCTGCGCCAGGKLQEIWRIPAPIWCGVGCSQTNDLGRASAGDSGHYGLYLANFQGLVALMFADRLFERKNNQTPAQTTDQNRWPIFMVADLDSENVAFCENVNASQQVASALFNLVECSEHFAGGRKNSWLITLSRERFLPVLQQWIGGFHRLRGDRCASRFRAPFRR